MASFPSWIRSLGNAGALENARQACAERRQAEQVLAARLVLLDPSPRAGDVEAA
jgi:hypothetical protein